MAVVAGLGMGDGRNASIRDVARAAGVSHQTVSRVINGHPAVKESTRQQVLVSIRELGFRPNRAARALASGRTRSVTVLSADTTLYGYAATLQGIEEAARSAGFSVGIRVLDAPAPATVRAAVEQVSDPAAGAVIVIAFDLAGVRALAAVPPGVMVAAVVEASEARRRHPYPCVWLDDRAAAAMATRYLLELGHQTVHYVSIPSSTRTSDRMKGWRSALQAAGVAVPDPVPGAWTPRSGYQAGLRLAADERVTAVLCGNDDLALGVLHAMREAGRSVPGDVSVVGFDDAPQSAFYAPPLTTVRLDFVGLGRDCFGLLQGLVDPLAGGQPLTVAQPQLVVRDTTGPPQPRPADAGGGGGAR
jgi:DNA-binding LacI/PurR family transcriptional regulator